MPDDTNIYERRFDRLRTSLNYLVNGNDPFSQEPFLDGSVWKHPDISRMLKSIIDDESDICFLISEILGDEKFISEKAFNSKQALSKYNDFNPDLIILDVWLGSSEFDGLELLSKFKDLNPLIPVIVISGHGNVDMAVSAIKMGAYDFIEKPFNSEKLIVTCKRAIESALLINENNKLKSIVSPSIPLIGKSSFILQLKKNINKIAESNSRVFISGSMGSGKNY